jgi:cytochrome P450
VESSAHGTTENDPAVQHRTAGAKPVFFVYRYDDILEVLRDGETNSSGQIIELIMGDVMGRHIMLGMDDPEHRRYRALVSTAFGPKAIARWEAQLIDPIASDLIDCFAGRGHAELVREFTFPYPTQVIAGMLGLPRADYQRFQRWSIAILSVFTRREAAIAASEQVKDYLARILDDRRREPRDDLISDLAQAELDGERLSDEEIFSFLRLLLPAGVETTYRSTGNLLFSLLSRPDQLAAVRADRSLIPQAIEETARYEAPLLNITRIATRDTVLGGVPIPAGSTVMTMLAAANRDESRWNDPDHYDIFRAARPSVAWGRTSASACTWPGSRCGSRSTSCSTGCPACALTLTVTTRTSAGRCSAPPPRCRSCSGSTPASRRTP